MCDHASIKPLALSKELDWENVKLDTKQTPEDNGDGSTYHYYAYASVDSADEAVQEPKTKRTAIGGEVITENVPVSAVTTETVHCTKED
jgi:hypothetical protein